jgi:oligosaccharide repeat unit polymerase
MLNLPVTYFISVSFAAVLLVYGGLNLHKSWGVPYLAVVFTIAAWYFVEPLYLPDEFQGFRQETLATAYGAVLIALLSFAFSTRTFVDLMRPKRDDRILSKAYVPPERVLVGFIFLWLILLVYGIVRMHGDVFAALFPLGGRSAPYMWGRPAAANAGDDGFIVATASYLYVLCLASFGILYTLIRKRFYAILAIILIAISWPYAALQGSRNVLLAVVLPGLGSYLLFSRHKLVMKSFVFSGSFLALELVLRIIIYYRNAGFENVDLSQIEGTKHNGLDMASELVYCLQYIQDGTLNLSFGQGYLEELANVIPRTIWPDKPLIGVDYSVARGFGGASNDIGLYATITTGVIGGGVLNFGPIFGPIWVGLLMSVWVGLLSRFYLQRTPLRLTLFLVGLGLTFNLGRNISLLVLWPLVFGYIGVRLVEWRTSVGRPLSQALRPRTPT